MIRARPRPGQRIRAGRAEGGHPRKVAGVRDPAMVGVPAPGYTALMDVVQARWVLPIHSPAIPHGAVAIEE